jgi:hypothetical protein
MTQEDKQLLLKDLCGRLPYGVIFKDECDENLHEIYYIRDEDIYTRTYPNLPSWIETIKPYLRPISSMTEEEQDEFFDLIICVDNGKAVVEEDKIDAYNEFMYSHHFDYRGLIQKGLALEAPNGMYD